MRIVRSGTSPFLASFVLLIIAVIPAAAARAGAAVPARQGVAVNIVEYGLCAPGAGASAGC